MLEVLTLEFKTYLTKEQEEIIDFFLKVQRHVWNNGLRRLCDYDEFSGYAPKKVTLLADYPPAPLLDKKGKPRQCASAFKTFAKGKDAEVGGLHLPCCPLPYDYRYVYTRVEEWEVEGEVKSGEVIVTNYRDLDSEDQKKCERYLVPYTQLLDHRACRQIKQLKRYKLITPNQQGEFKEPLDHSKNTYTAPHLTYAWGWKWQTNENGVPEVLYRKHPDWREPNCQENQGWGQDHLYPEVERVDLYIRDTGFKSSGGIAQSVKGEVLDLIRLTQEHPEWIDQIKKVRYKINAGTIKNLATSWQEYDKSRFGVNNLSRGKPKFKRRQDQIKTLSHPNPKKDIVPHPTEKDRLRGVPGLGILKVKGLTQRWRWYDPKTQTDKVPEILAFKLCRRPSGYYVQLSGEFPSPVQASKSNVAVGIDPGLLSLLSLDSDKKYNNPRFLRNAEKRLKRLQRRLSRKLIKRLILWLKSPQTTSEDIRLVCPHISKDDAKRLCQAELRDEKDIKQIISQSACNTLKYRHYEYLHVEDRSKSSREQKLQEQIAKLHERIRLSRRHHNHKLSTYISRTYGAVAIEDGVQSNNLRRQAKKKLREDGSGYEKNRKKQKSGLSKSLVDAAPGQLISFLERKVPLAGGEFRRVDGKNTTKECPVCGTLNKLDLSDRYYICSNPTCYYEGDRDTTAAINILTKAEFGESYDYSELYLSARKGRCEYEKDHQGASNPDGKKTIEKKRRKPAAQ